LSGPLDAVESFASVDRRLGRIERPAERVG
jgi:hypothetical protein